MIPQSLKVTTDIAKYIISLIIMYDKNLKDKTLESIQTVSKFF
jgi:hypothetical protein